MSDTIFAVSSGQPPAAIAVIRVSGPAALAAAEALAGTLPLARTAGLRALRGDDGALLDRALALVFPGPATATGEDLVELHCHGGRAVVAAVASALSRQAGVRLAQPGEFTRRALANGRIDLAEAEGLADLLSAETEAQRVAALAATEGRLSRIVEEWLGQVAMLSARVEAMLDYADEEDVASDDADLAEIRAAAIALGQQITDAAAVPPVERLRDGVRVVLAGPPNAGKSTLLNLLTEREAAIVSPIAGTTRDKIEAGVIRRGRSYLLIDTAGLTETNEPIEAIGVERATAAITSAELLVWLGDMSPPRADALWVHARADLPERRERPLATALAVSRNDDVSIEALWAAIERRCDLLLPRADALPMKQHQQRACTAAGQELLTYSDDPLILAEHYRLASRGLASITGQDATEAMLEALFSRFCLGK